MGGRKISWNHENPIDNILIYITEKLNPLYKLLHFTPNILTTFSLLFTLVGLYIYTKNYIILGPILYFIGYYFDCADGNYARLYNMQTKFGDYYDHIADTFKILVLIYVLYISNININTKCFIFIILLLLLILSEIHLGCQEKIYDKSNESYTLSILKPMCYNEDYITYSKYFGSGTLQLTIMFLLIFLKKINKYIYK